MAVHSASAWLDTAHPLYSLAIYGCCGAYALPASSRPYSPAAPPLDAPLNSLLSVGLRHHPTSTSALQVRTRTDCDAFKDMGPASTNSWSTDGIGIQAPALLFGEYSTSRASCFSTRIHVPAKCRTRLYCTTRHHTTLNPRGQVERPFVRPSIPFLANCSSSAREPAASQWLGSHFSRLLDAVD